ncbi:hypothetical protein H9P43_008887 [Blastocladiella emersonii ATCC 22665]|nr:hypothetical protein H9P43_008887 [Blastocladiella emersonii ATCC 22665]
MQNAYEVLIDALPASLESLNVMLTDFAPGSSITSSRDWSKFDEREFATRFVLRLPATVSARVMDYCEFMSPSDVLAASFRGFGLADGEVTEIPGEVYPGSNSNNDYGGGGGDDGGEEEDSSTETDESSDDEY